MTPGLTLRVGDVPEHFRGYPTRSLAVRVAGDGVLDAATIGAAANAFHRAPEAWRAWGSDDDVLTCFRRLWHVVVKYGVPAEHPPRRA